MNTTGLYTPTNELSKTRVRRATRTKAPLPLAQEALTSLPAFADLIEYQGGWENFSDCHTELAEFITQPQLSTEGQNKWVWSHDERALGLRRLVLMPRGHLKSTIGTTLYALWRLYRNPELRIFVGCKDQKLSFSFIRELRQWLENEELQKKVWNNRPHIAGNLIPEINKRSRERNRNTERGDDTEAEDRKLIWNNTALQVMRKGRYKEPSVFAGSVGASVTGQHYDIVILDDIIDFKNTESEVKKQRVEEWALDIESVINPPQLVDCPGGFKDVVGGEFVVSGTRYVVDDLYAQILERQEELQYITHVRNIYKNGIDASEGYLWKEKYTDAVIRALKSRISPRRFASQYLNTVYEKDHALLDLAACTVLETNAVYTQAGKTFVGLPGGRQEEIACIVCIDPAFSAGKNGDDCAIVVGARLSDGRLLVVDAALDRMDAADVVKKTVAFCTKYNTLRVFHESNGVGMLVPELFKSQATFVAGRALVINSHYEQRPKEAKIQGVLELPFALGQLVFVREVWENERIHKQMKNYPATSHDDFLDALVTLQEKAIGRRQPKTSQRTTFAYQLYVDKAADAVGKPTPSLLGTYNNVFL